MSDATANDDIVHCMDEINQEVATYWGFVYASLGLTVVSIFVRRYIRSLEASHPSFRPYAYFFLGIGVLKVLLGILLVTILLPACPSDCSCNRITIGHPTYGYIAMGLGLWWLYQGSYYYKKANEGVEYTSGDGIAMTKPEVSTTSAVAFSDDKDLV